MCAWKLNSIPLKFVNFSRQVNLNLRYSVAKNTEIKFEKIGFTQMVKSSAAIKCENFRIFNKVLHSQKRFFVSVDFVC